jgi:hypothetical protein
MLTSRFLVGGAMLLTTSLVSAEVENIATPDPECNCIRFWHRPKVVAPTGWTIDDEAGTYHQIAALAPGNASFDDSQVVMYARAIRKSDQHKNLRSFVQAAADTQRKANATNKIINRGTLKRSDKTEFVLVEVTPKPSQQANFDYIAYGEEGEFWIAYVLSAQDLKTREKYAQTFRSFVTSQSR